MSTIIKFPLTDNSRQRLNNRKVESQDSKQKIVYTPVYVYGLSDVKNKLDDINDTLKYVTDGLYSIALELRELKVSKSFWLRFFSMAKLIKKVKFTKSH